MIISLIVAMSRNRVMGVNQQLPWHLPADLQHFKQLTLGKPIIMGRKTYESIGKPLPKRKNIVVTRQNNYDDTGINIAHSLDEALALAKPSTEAMIIGGAELFLQALPVTHYLYITEVDCELSGDTYFPEFDQTQWQESERKTLPADPKNAYATTYITLKRADRPKSFQDACF